MAGPPATDRPDWGAPDPSEAAFPTAPSSTQAVPAPPKPPRRPEPPRQAPPDHEPPLDAKAKRAEARRLQAQQAAAKRAKMEQTRSERALAKQAAAEGRAKPPRPSRSAQPQARGPAPRVRAPRGTGRVAASAPAGPATRGRRAEPARRPATGRGRFRQRYGVVYDVDGPRVRLGVAWFGLALVAIVLGPLTTSLVYAGAAALAAAQTARAWRKQGLAPNDVMAAAGAGLMGLGAAFGSATAGVAVLGTVALAFFGAAGDQTSRHPRIVDIGATLQCALAPGFVALSIVLLARLDQGSAIGLLLLVSAYETGDYLIGSGAVNPYEGPGAGAAGIVVVTFILSTLPISALSFGEAWAFGGAVALLAPAGQLLGSALLPAADTPASALRRLDSLLITAPLWAIGVGLVV